MLPPPVVADVDGDGAPDVVIATADGRLQLATPQSALEAADGGAAPRGGAWRDLTVRRTASLRTHTGLSTGRRPMALRAGHLRLESGGGVRRQVVVVVTEDWTVLAFDHELRLLWEHSLGRSSLDSPVAADGAALRRHAYLREVAVSVSAHPIYAGDRGAVLVAGHAHPPHVKRTDAAAANSRVHAQGAEAGGL